MDYKNRIQQFITMKRLMVLLIALTLIFFIKGDLIEAILFLALYFMIYALKEKYKKEYLITKNEEN